MRHLEVVAAIIINKSKILCMRRPESEKKYISLKYEFPGGKIEAGETRTAALMRELFEELDLTIEINDRDYFMTVEHRYPDFQLTMDSYICHLDVADFVRKEHIDHKWLKLMDLPSLDWAEADLPIVAKLMELRLC